MLIILVVIATASAPMVTGGYSYQAPSQYLELPNIQSSNGYGQLAAVHNYQTQNAQSASFSNYNDVQAPYNIVRNNVQATYSYEVPRTPITAPLSYQQQRITVYPTATGVQPPHLRNNHPQTITLLHQESSSSSGGPYSAIVNNQQLQQRPTTVLNAQGNNPMVTTGLNSNTNYSPGPVYYGFQPVAPQLNVVPSIVQQQNLPQLPVPANQPSVQQHQVQYNNAQELQIQNYVAEDGDEETVIEEEIPYQPNVRNYQNQQLNEELLNRVTVNNVVNSNTHINVENPVAYETGISSIAPQTVITKHIYFHAPPLDLEEAPLKSNVSPPAKKLFNIIFIKVPSQDYLNRAEILRQVQGRQNSVEDKTLIYVLVKKPEPLMLAAGAPAPPPNKPEVFFVKYKTASQNEQTLQNHAPFNSQQRNA